GAAPARAAGRVPSTCRGGHASNLATVQGGFCPLGVTRARRRRNARRNATRQEEGRLPDGSAILATYYAATTTWTGELYVPGAGTFAATAPGVRRLCDLLGHAYQHAPGALAPHTERPPAPSPSPSPP